MTKLDATMILPSLYQGSRPPLGGAVASNKFDVLVLAAREYQPDADMFPGVHVIHAPLDDRPITRQDHELALRVADDVAYAVQAGAKVLVTCLMGLNRSGLITALAMHRLTGMGGHAAEKIIRGKRKMALFNPSFVRVLRNIRPIR